MTPTSFSVLSLSSGSRRWRRQGRQRRESLGTGLQWRYVTFTKVEKHQSETKKKRDVDNLVSRAFPLKVGGALPWCWKGPPTFKVKALGTRWMYGCIWNSNQKIISGHGYLGFFLETFLDFLEPEVYDSVCRLRSSIITLEKWVRGGSRKQRIN